METPWPFIICNKCGLRSVPIKCNDSPYGQRTKAKSYKEARAEAIANWNERPQEERAKIVAWLRERDGFNDCYSELKDQWLSDRIARGEHLK